MVKHPCQRNEFGKNLDIFIAARPSGKNDLEQLLKGEQPKGQLEIRRIDHQCAVAEAMRILIVTVEQKNPHVRTHRQYLAQKDARPLDLPTPVLPRMAKCLLIMSWTLA